MSKINLDFNWDKAIKYSSVALIIFSLAYIVLYLKFSIGVVLTPYQYDYGEGFHWYLSNMLANGHNIYHSINQEPYITVVYGPMYYLASALGIKMFGSSVEIGRIVSLLATLVSCVFIYKIVKVATSRIVPSIVSAVVPLTVGFFGFWSVMFRVDALAMCFSLIGIYLVLKNFGTKSIYWAIPLFLLAMFTKQSYVAAPFAMLVYLFFKDRRRCFIFLGGLLSGGLVLIGLFTAIFGTSFIQQTFLVGNQPHNWHVGQALLKLVLYSIPVGIGLSFAHLINRVKKKSLDFFSIYFIIATGICVLLISKDGAWLNYAMEMVVASSLLVGVVAGNLLNTPSPKTKKQFVLVAALLILPLSPMGSWYNYHVPENVKESYVEIMPYLENTNGPVICEDATLAMQSGAGLVWEPSVFVQGGYYRDIWDQTPFVGQIESKEFKVVVLNYPVETWWLPQDPLPYPRPHERLTEEMAQAIVDNYSLVWNSSSYWMYLPNGQECDER